MAIMRLAFYGGTRDGVVMDVDWQQDARALCERQLGEYYVWGATCPTDEDEEDWELYVEGCPRSQPDIIPPVSLSLWHCDTNDRSLMAKFVVME